VKAVAVHPEERYFGLVDHPEPSLGRPTEVRARVLEVGVCGTDREIARFEYGEPPEGFDHLVIGHESLAEVVEVGPEAGDLRPGDLVVTMVRRPCPHTSCRPCRIGRQDFCTTGDFTERGIKGRHGFMTEQVVDDARFMVRLPEELRLVGVLTEPLTIAQKALEEVWTSQDRLPWTDPDLPPEERGRGLRALVLGAGPVGLLGAMALVLAGFETSVYSRSSAPNPKASLAESIGARYVSSSDNDLDALVRISGQPDVVYEAAGVARAALETTRVLGPNGVFVLTGVPGPELATPLESSALMRRMVLGNQVILGTVNAGKATYEAAVEKLAAFQRLWPDALAALVTGRHPIEDANDLLTGQSRGIKDVIRVRSAT
jgi:threonine dehydrogenase-like Zn-dependent dehydrogenase